MLCILLKCCTHAKYCSLKNSTCNSIVSHARGVLCLLVCPRPPEVLLATVDIVKEEYNPGDAITYICNAGYIPQSGQRSYVCPLSGRWPFVTFRCIRKYIFCPSVCLIVCGIHNHPVILRNSPGDFLSKTE